MAKKAEIISITINEGTAEVGYATGTVRKYPENEIPKTVQAWLDKYQVSSTDEVRYWRSGFGNVTGRVDDERVFFGSYTQVRDYIMDILAGDGWYDIFPECDSMVETHKRLAPERIIYLAKTDEPEEEDIEEAIAEEPIEEMVEETVIEETAIEEAPQLPVVVETETAIEVVENEVSEECRKDSEEFGNSEGFEAVRAVATMVASSVKIAVAAIRTAAPVAVKAIAWTANKVVDLYFWLTTYCPIAARWLTIHLAWFIQDAIPVITGAARKAGAAARVAGRGIVHGTATLAGWGLVAGLTAISLSLKTAEVVAEGWKLREEIIAEQAA